MMTDIFCDADCKHAVQQVSKEGFVEHTNCTADAINLFFAKKERHPCTMYEKR